LAEVDVDWLIAERPGKVKTLKQHPRKNKTAINIEYMKASIRAKVEHPFRIIKRQFGFVKARYKGLLKNDNQLAMLFTLAGNDSNLLIVFYVQIMPDDFVMQLHRF
ncbi:transposase, partial [Escherichia coli]